MPMWSRDSAPSHHLDSDGRSTRTRRATSSAQASLRACPAEASSIRDASTSHFPQVFLRLCAVVTLASPTVRFKRQRLGKGRIAHARPLTFGNTTPDSHRRGHGAGPVARLIRQHSPHPVRARHHRPTQWLGPHPRWRPGGGVS